jgi:hypothetical protein
MKSNIGFSILAVAALSLGTMAYAAGPAAGRGASNGTSAQTRIHTPGTGLVTGTPTQTRIGAGVTGTAPCTRRVLASPRSPQRPDSRPPRRVLPLRCEARRQRLNAPLPARR